ncbi:MAG: hypothetical protein K9N47_21060 [Prosthecobacter sp.]|uniref:terminase large subunit domain-containing protein n=1 Tax=Prosthecobacter sp. TaxID=1965333 RepID=UPI0026097172|nr:terminase family protein [Prosthecobacter sp.]MCF7788626.1 hypothetical protein [Prosthecobacter sp.]
MAAILPAINIDSQRADAKFLTYQLAWIKDDSRMRLAEKSVRIGWTYADAFKNVRKRLHHADRDYLFATRDQPSAAEYVQTCMKFCEIYDLTKSILSHGEDTMNVPRMDSRGKETGFTDEVKFCYIKFDNGSRIMAFSSNPQAMRVHGGDVGLDEFAFHPQQDALWETAQGRITMGYDIGVWSAHNGTDTLFYEFAQEAREGLGGWSYYRVTMEDAIENGYLDMIKRRTDKQWTREAFIADCKTRARLPEIYEQAYNCNPRGSSSSAVPWSSIEQCTQLYDIERMHFEAEQIPTLFQPFSKFDKSAREGRIESFLDSVYPEHRARVARHTLGFDVAASGQGDLACLYCDEKNGANFKLRSLLTCRTDDWHFLETAASWFMKRTASLTACGDETGLGRQICWNLAQNFPGQFHPINFSRSKHDMGFALMNQMAVAEKQWPKTHDLVSNKENEHRDIAQDFFALRKLYQGGRWIYSEGPNNFNPASHCDIAWAGGLSSEAAKHELSPCTPPKPFGRTRSAIASAARRVREVLG